MIEARRADALAIGVLAVVAVIAAATFRDYGLGWDDYTHAQYGQLLLDFYASGFHDTRAFSFVNLYRYGGGFDMAAALLAKVLPFGLFETRRLAGAVVGLIGLLATWRLGRRVGGPLAGLLSVALLAACPLYYGHMFMNPKDAPFAAMMAVALLGTVRAFEEYPRPTPVTVLLLGLGFGLSVGSRIMGGFAIAGAVAALALIVAAEGRAQGMGHAGARLRRFLRAVLPAVVVAIAAMALVWPWSVLDPGNLPRAIFYFSQFFEKPWRELYGGELILATEMPRSYVPVLLGLKLPEILLALAIAGLIWALVMALRPAVPVQRRAILLSIVLAASLPVAVAVATRPAMYNGVRHFLFIVPPLALLAGLMGSGLLERARQLGGAVLATAAAVIFLGIVSPVVEMMRLHPYQYVHFNHLAGGVRGAEGRYMLDYWGLAFRQASLGLLRVLTERRLEPEGGRKTKIAVCGPHPPAEVVLGERFELTWDPKGADLAMMLGAFYCRNFDAPVLLEVRRQGVLFARVYDIRGREFDSLFTLPPVRSD
jgi:4-amino-4-deoxy-L-arabinose transferase-like glycosyltransferase